MPPCWVTCINEYYFLFIGSFFTLSIVPFMILSKSLSSSNNGLTQSHSTYTQTETYDLN